MNLKKILKKDVTEIIPGGIIIGGVILYVIFNFRDLIWDLLYWTILPIFFCGIGFVVIIYFIRFLIKFFYSAIKEVDEEFKKRDKYK